MLFVFGKRAKKLRLNKVSELIHKSDACSDATFARVSVYFQDIIDTGPGDEDYQLVPGTEIVITRIARKDNSSSYKIDGKNCQFKEVAAYLGAKGIDLDNNRFLILQGEVEMISMMPPKGKNEGDEGLLEYLEDIIGSNKYVEETERAAEVVEALTEQRQEKLNRVKAIEKEKDSLHGAKQEAEQLLKKERDIRRKQNVLYQIYSMKASEELENYRLKKASAEEKLTAERERLATADERLRELETSLKRQKAEYNKVHAELEKTADEFSAYERRDTKLREEIKYCKAQKKKLEAKVKQHEKTIEECRAKAEQAENSIPQLEVDIVALTEVKAKEDTALEDIYEQLKGVVQKLRTELEQKTQELAPVNQERAVFQAALDTATTEVNLLEDGVTRAKERLVAAEKELAAIDQKQESKRQELAAAEDELTAAKERVVDAEKEETALAEKESKLSKRYTQLMVCLHKFRTCLSKRLVRVNNPLAQTFFVKKILVFLFRRRQKKPKPLRIVQADLECLKRFGVSSKPHVKVVNYPK
jgi:structural maintenance of chromosome 4